MYAHFPKLEGRLSKPARLLDFLLRSTPRSLKNPAKTYWAILCDWSSSTGIDVFEAIKYVRELKSIWNEQYPEYANFYADPRLMLPNGAQQVDYNPALAPGIAPVLPDSPVTGKATRYKTALYESTWEQK